MRYALLLLVNQSRWTHYNLIHTVIKSIATAIKLGLHKNISAQRKLFYKLIALKRTPFIAITKVAFWKVSFSQIFDLHFRIGYRLGWQLEVFAFYYDDYLQVTSVLSYSYLNLDWLISILIGFRLAHFRSHSEYFSVTVAVVMLVYQSYRHRLAFSVLELLSLSTLAGFRYFWGLITFYLHRHTEVLLILSRKDYWAERIWSSVETDEYSHQVQHLESNLFGLLESFDSSIFVPISFIEFIIFIHDMPKSTPSTQCTVHSLRHNVRDDWLLTLSVFYTFS